MNREKCIMCGHYMGNSLNKVAGEPVHVRCMKNIEKIEIVDIKYQTISVCDRICSFFKKIFKR